MNKAKLFSALSQEGKTACIGLYGIGGFAREVMPLLQEYAREFTQLYQRSFAELYYIQTKPEIDSCNGLPVLSEDEFFARPAHLHLYNIAVGSSLTREKLAKSCAARGGLALTVSAPDHRDYSHNNIGEGAILCGHTIVTANAKIGSFFHANLFSYVAHDCVIGDFVTFAPRVSCNGNVIINDHVYVGTSAMLRQGTPDKPLVIGRGAVIGMGAVVTKDVPEGATVVGNPARPIEKTQVSA